MNFKELILEKKAKKPKIIEELSAWLTVVVKGLEIKDQPNHKPFKSKVAVGSTEYIFPTGKEAKDMMDKLYTMKKYEKLYISWGGHVLVVDWKELDQKPDDV